MTPPPLASASPVLGLQVSTAYLVLTHPVPFGWLFSSFLVLLPQAGFHSSDLCLWSPPAVSVPLAGKIVFSFSPKLKSLGYVLAVACSFL